MNENIFVDCSSVLNGTQDFLDHRIMTSISLCDSMRKKYCNNIEKIYSKEGKR